MAHITASGSLQETGRERLDREKAGISAAQRIKELRHSEPIEAVICEPTPDGLDDLRAELDELGVSYSMQAKETTLKKKLTEAKGV